MREEGYTDHDDEEGPCAMLFPSFGPTSLPISGWVLRYVVGRRTWSSAGGDGRRTFSSRALVRVRRGLASKPGDGAMPERVWGSRALFTEKKDKRVDATCSKFSL